MIDHLPVIGLGPGVLLIFISNVVLDTQFVWSCAYGSSGYADAQVVLQLCRNKIKRYIVTTSTFSIAK